MSLLQAIIMGFVQGVAEFLPISSSGHLAIIKHILNIDLEASGGMVFDVMLHFGTLLAIFVVFWKDIKKMIMEGICILSDFFYNVGMFCYNHTFGIKREKHAYKRVVNSAYRKFVMLVIVSTIPTGIIGILIKDIVEAASQTLLVPGICLMITAGLLLLADFSKAGKKRPNQISYVEAGVVGIAQGIATLPGISRSGTTIAACLTLGFDKNFAVKYSFIMSIPAVLGACILEIKDFTNAGLSPSVLAYYVVGMLVAAAVGYVCIKTMLLVVRGKKFKGFAYYCFIIGTIALVWNFTM